MNIDGLMGIKKYQGQAFLEDGKRVPLTAILASGNVVTQVKTAGKEGYDSIQLGFGKNKKANKTKLGNGKKAGLEYSPVLFREIRMEAGELKAGTEIKTEEVFKAGDIIDVIGTSKGKGFAGVVKRHHFKGGPRTHGQSDRERAPGSIGQTTTPGRVYKGKRMAGRMGHEQVTVKNLLVLDIKEDGTILIKGLVPGSVNSMVMIKKVKESKKFVPLYKEVIEEPVQAQPEVQEQALEALPAAETQPVTEEVQPASAETSNEAKAEANVELEAEVAENVQRPVEETQPKIKPEENKEEQGKEPSSA
jgi:large subunit ribosomal protein L3